MKISLRENLHFGTIYSDSDSDSDFESGIGVFPIFIFPQTFILNPQSEKHQSLVQNHQLVILSPIGDFHF